MAVVNRTAGALSFSTSNPITIPAVASGNSLLILVTAVPNRAPTSLTDNGGGSPTYTFDVTGQQLEGSDAASHPHAYIIRRNNITTAPTQVTITTADNAAGTYNIIEYDNLSAAGPVESNIATRSFATSNTATVTTGAANRIGVGFAGSGSNTRDHATTDTGWVTPSAPTGAIGARSFDNADLGAAGSESLTTTIPTAQWLVTALYAYAAEAGPAVPSIDSVTPSTLGRYTQSLVIEGENFGTTGSVKISPADDVDDADAVVQNIDARSDTSITANGAKLPAGTATGDTLYLFVIDSEGASNAAGFPLTVSWPAAVPPFTSPRIGG